MPLSNTAISKAKPSDKPQRLFDGGGLVKAKREQTIEEESWELIAILRLAALLCRNRRDPDQNALRYQRDGSAMRLIIDPQWLADSPLTETLLEEEIQQWKAVGGSLEVEYRQTFQKNVPGKIGAG